MTHYIETKTKNGAVLRIEVEDTSKPSPGFTRTATASNVSGESADNAYTEVLQAIEGLANGLVDTVQKLDSEPATAALEFSVKIDGEVGAMIAKRRDEGQFKVALSWKEPETNQEK